MPQWEVHNCAGTVDTGKVNHVYFNRKCVTDRQTDTHAYIQTQPCLFYIPHCHVHS